MIQASMERMIQTNCAYPNRRRLSKQTEQWLTGADWSSKTIFS
jgi:hypothetical protein